MANLADFLSETNIASLNQMAKNNIFSYLLLIPLILMTMVTLALSWLILKAFKVKSKGGVA